MDDKRRAVCKRTLLSRRVVIDISVVYDCTIRDLSDTGAKLVFATPTLTLDEFRLELPQQQRSVWTRVAWHKGTAVGVRFTSEGLGSQVA